MVTKTREKSMNFILKVIRTNRLTPLHRRI